MRARWPALPRVDADEEGCAEDIKRLAEIALRETAERKNRDFREALGLATFEHR